MPPEKSIIFFSRHPVKPPIQKLALFLSRGHQKKFEEKSNPLKNYVSFSWDDFLALEPIMPPSLHHRTSKFVSKISTKLESPHRDFLTFGTAYEETVGLLCIISLWLRHLHKLFFLICPNDSLWLHCNSTFGHHPRALFYLCLIHTAPKVYSYLLTECKTQKLVTNTLFTQEHYSYNKWNKNAHSPKGCQKYSGKLTYTLPRY